MLEAIRGAQRTVLFETFIYWSGEIGNEFAEALSERARAGVKVHVLLDWVGSTKVDRAWCSDMKMPAWRCGCSIRCAGTTWAA
jgi:cardiolipin synthase